MKAQSGSTVKERVELYTSTLSLTSALYCGRRSTPRPGRFSRGKETLYRRVGAPRDPFGRVWKISLPPGFEPRTVRPERVAVTTTLHLRPLLQWYHTEGMRANTPLGLYTSTRQHNHKHTRFYRNLTIILRYNLFCFMTTKFTIQGVSKRALQFWKLIEIYTEDIHNVLNCQNVAKHTEFYLE